MKQSIINTGILLVQSMQTIVLNHLIKQNVILLLISVIILGRFNVFSQECTFTTNIPPNGQISLNGIQITTTSSGSVDLYTLTPTYTSCGLYTVNSNPLWVGQNGPWSITFNFNVPVNNLLFVIAATGNTNNEDFIFNGNSGPVSVASSSNCYSTFSGNTILSGAGADPLSGGGGGFFTVNAATPYTQLIINGAGGENGSLMAVCAASIVESPECAIATVTPEISQTSVCTTSTNYDLSGNTASNTPANSTFNWFSSTPATAAGLIADPTSVGFGTYYGAYYDTLNNCYSLTTSFSVNPVPVAAFSNNGTCQGSPVSFTDESTLATGTIAGWNWDFGDASMSTIQNPFHTFTSGLSNSVSLTVTSAAGCSSSVTQIVDLNPAPIADFEFLAGCANDPVSFTDQSVITSGTITNWDWDFGDGSSSAIQSPTHQYSSGSGYTVSLIVTSDFGCTHSVSQQVSTSAPVADFDYTAVCLNNLTQFTDLSLPNGGIITNWSWNFGDGNSSTLQHPSHQYGNTGNYTVVLTVTSDAGCTDSVSQELTVFANPIAAFNVIGACSGIAVPFTDLSTIDSGTITSWSWDFGDGNSSAMQEPSYVFTNGGTFDVTLNVSSNEGCTGFTTQSVVITQSPSALFSYCPPSPDIMHTTVHFNNSSTNAISYNWDFAGEGTSQSTNSLFTFPEMQGNYEVMLVASNGECTDTMRATIVIKDVLIYYIPNTFTPDGDEFNQLFKPVFTTGFDPYDFNMKIVDRWGEIIFESRDATIGWDGTYHGLTVPNGTYTWLIEFKTRMSDERVIINGHVTVIK